jgi:sulfur transfer complex TusBCD TusB component (DsrH family)
MKLNDPAVFSETLLNYFMEQGWQSLSKRDLELLIFILLEKDGVIDKFASNHTIAKQLRLTPAKISALRKDSYARWRPLLGITGEDMIKHILKNTLTEKKLASGARYAAEKTARDGFLALMIEHPDYRAELEEALKNLDAIPVYERNPQVILIHHDTLFELAKQFDLLDDFKDIQSNLKSLCSDKVKDLEGFLKKKAKDLTWDDVRAALSATTAKVIAKQVENVSLVTLLQLAMPFLI